MPCQSMEEPKYGRSGEDSRFGHAPSVYGSWGPRTQDVQEIDRLTRLLCDACRTIVSIESAKSLSPELFAWYTIHKAEDDWRVQQAELERKQAEEKQQREAYLQSIRERLVNQLTDDEKESLGLKGN